MACAKAIVGTKAGGIPEVVDDGVTGLLVEPRDHHGLAAAIVRLTGTTVGLPTSTMRPRTFSFMLSRNAVSASAVGRSGGTN